MTSLSTTTPENRVRVRSPRPSHQCLYVAVNTLASLPALNKYLGAMSVHSKRASLKRMSLPLIGLLDYDIAPSIFTGGACIRTGHQPARATAPASVSVAGGSQCGPIDCRADVLTSIAATLSLRSPRFPPSCGHGRTTHGARWSRRTELKQ